MRRYLPALIVLLALAARLIPGPRVVDDAYITFRYARNLIEGQGLVYNPGEAVLGTTTPLFSLIMAGLGAIGGSQASYPWMALLVSAAADSLTCLLLLRLGRTGGFEKAGLAAAFIWAVHPYAVTFAIGGMETSLFVFLLLAAGIAHLEQRRVPAALCAALALVTRPDAAILVGLLVLDRLWGILHRKEAWPGVAEGLAFVLPLAAWYGFAWIYYGSPLPHSITAKMAAYRLGEHAAFIRLLQHYSQPFMGNHLTGPAGVMLGLVIFPVLVLLGARPVLKKIPSAWPLVLYPWFYLLVFSLPNPLIFRWYLTPPLPMYILIVLAGIERLIRGLPFTASLPRRQKWAAAILMFALPLASLLSEWVITPDHGNRTPCPDMAWTKLEDLYSRAADVVLRDWQPGDVVAAGDVGMLGWKTRAPILDLVGLNSPLAGHYYPLPAEKYVINYAIPADLILDARPAYVVVLEVYGRETIFKEERFKQQYNLLEKIPTDFYGSDGLLVYEINR
jgi:hypothetical protein